MEILFNIGVEKGGGGSVKGKQNMKRRGVVVRGGNRLESVTRL